jgi:hypothetical protein
MSLTELAGKQMGLPHLMLKQCKGRTGCNQPAKRYAEGGTENKMEAFKLPALVPGQCSRPADAPQSSEEPADSA